MIYFLGKYFKFIRLWYYKKTGKWRWGICSAVREIPIKTMDTEINKEFDNYLKIIFEK